MAALSPILLACFASLAVALTACGGSGVGARPDRDRGLGDAPLRADADAEPLRGDLAAGVRSLRDGEVDAAIASLRRHLQAHPKSALALYHLGLCALQQDRRDEARKLFEAALALQPQLHGAASNLGALYLEAGEDIAALQSLQQAQQLAPQDPRVLVNLAAALLRRGLWSEAIEVLQEARELAPGHGTLLYNFALAWMERYEYTKAMELLDEALVYRPRFALARALRVVCLHEQGRLAEATEYAKLSLQEVGEPSADLHIVLGRTLVASGKVKEARAALEQATVIDKGSAPAQLALGELLDAAGARAQATHWYSLYLKNPLRSPDDAKRIRQRLKQLQAAQGS